MNKKRKKDRVSKNKNRFNRCFGGAKNGFTLIELIVVIVALGTLIGLSFPKFVEHKNKPTITKIQSNITVMEGEVMKDLVKGGKIFYSWGGTTRDLRLLVDNKGLYDAGGIVKTIKSSDYEGIKIIPKEIVASKLSKIDGTFYADNSGKVFYEYENIDSDIEPEVEEEVDDEDKENEDKDEGSEDNKDEDNKDDDEKDDCEAGDDCEDVEEEKDEVDESINFEKINDLIENKGYIPISNGEELVSMISNKSDTFGKGTHWENKYRSGLNRKYIQLSDIDMSNVNNFNGIGKKGDEFTGTFDGNNKSISNLTINNPKASYVGLFAQIDGATIKNIKLRNINIGGKNYIGSAVGYGEESKIINVSVVGNVDGNKYIGGILGYGEENEITESSFEGEVFGKSSYTGGIIGKSEESLIFNSFVNGNITGNKDVGGIAGYSDEGKLINTSFDGNVTSSKGYAGGLIGNEEDGKVENSYSKGRVKSPVHTGCLIGYSKDSKISNTHTDCVVTGSKNVGGLIGYSKDVRINNSSSMGSVSGSESVGGLLGYSDDVRIRNSYSLSSISGSRYLGGLIGRDKDGDISNIYSSGSVFGASYIGALVGRASDTRFRNSYYNKDMSNQSSFGEGLTEKEMKNKERYKGWDFNDIWIILKGEYPSLRENQE